MGPSDLSSRDSMMEDAVGVFWDYQSCPHPPEYTGSTVIQVIKALALAFGSIKQFNVYVNEVPHPKNKQWAAACADEILRKELHASGVSVVDCPTISGKTAADQMLIVDMFAFALQSRLPTTLVVISADPDLAYAVSLLKHRRFKPILITSSSLSIDTITALKSQSDDSFTWEDVLDGERTACGDLDVAPSLENSPTSRSHRSLRAASGDGPMGPITLATDPMMDDPAIPSQQSVTTPFESYEQASFSLRPHKPASSSDGLETFTNPTQTSGTISIEHLCEVIDLLVKAVHGRGWHLADIQKKVAASPKLAWKKTETVAHLEEGVRLGLLVHRLRPQRGAKPELHYYAVEAGLKAKWVQGMPDLVEFLGAQTNLTTGRQKDASGPASSSPYRIPEETGTRAKSPPPQVIFANKPPTSESEHVAEDTRSTQPQVSAGWRSPGTSGSNANTCPNAGSPGLVADSPNTAAIVTTPAKIRNPRVADVPDRLRDIIDALVQADRSRGWPQESIGYYLHRRDIQRWKDPQKVLAALEESVHLGLLISSVGISKKNKHVKTYYAVEDGLKKSWLSRIKKA